MNSVSVRELRQNLSVYLARVKRGEALSITESGQVVALLHPPQPDLLHRVRPAHTTSASEDLITERDDRF